MNKINTFGLRVAEVGQLYRLIFVLVLGKQKLWKELSFIYFSQYEITWNHKLIIIEFNDPYLFIILAVAVFFGGWGLCGND
jgi:hypothetical protein